MGVETAPLRNGVSDSVAMDVDDAHDTDAAASGSRFSINVLQLVKAAQGQHGLRHEDYTRYRRYCTARLLRLYKSLKFLHGRGKYVKKSIVVATVTDVRHLHMVLYLAERAWSYAMEIKQIQAKKNCRQRCHLIRRLAKAAKWGDLFAKLCAEKADSRTSLEAEAYASYMHGNLLLERETDWEKAAKKFKNAKAVYDELGKVGDIENQVLCRQRVEELEPFIKFCLYSLDNSDLRGSEILDLTKEENPALELLQSKLESVLAEARSQQAVSMTELEWLGRKHPVNNQKTRVCILKGQELEKDLQSPGPLEKKLAIYDKIFVAYQDAKRFIRDDMVTAGSAEDVRDQLNGLDRAVTSIVLQRTIDRNLILVSGAKNRLNRQRQGLREEKGEKPAKPEDLVRLCDTLIQNITDLSELTTSGRDKREEELSFSKALSAKLLLLQAERSFYLAQSYSLGSKYAEAYLLFNLAIETAESALLQLELGDTSVREELKSIIHRSRAEKCLVHARGITEETRANESLQTGVAKLAIKEQPVSDKEDVQYLLDKLGKYESAVGRAGSKEPPRIAQVPPPFQSVPCRPIVLDTALNSIEFPSLESRLRKEDKKRGFLSKWWQRA